jgi:REP element-mobilizing transposase RayT
MARPLRLDYPNTFYHVLSRGNEKRDIFIDERDHRKFLEIIGQMADRFSLELHAYVLMRNHYHLLIRTKKSNLSRAMQWLGVTYSVWFNRHHQRSGHLFQGRFKSFVIENERYFAAMSLYIHGNPLRAGVVDSLASYPWSSYFAYADERRRPSWLTTDLILTMNGGRAGFLGRQRSLLENKERVLKDLKHGLYLGGEAFAEECIRRAKGEEHREKPQMRRLLRQKSIETLSLEILEQLGETDPASQLNPRKRFNHHRDVAIFVLYQLGIYGNAEIGRIFGVGYTAVSEAVKRARRHLDSNDHLQQTVRAMLIDN